MGYTLIRELPAAASQSKSPTLNNDHEKDFYLDLSIDG